MHIAELARYAHDFTVIVLCLRHTWKSALTGAQFVRRSSNSLVLARTTDHRDLSSTSRSRMGFPVKKSLDTEAVRQIIHHQVLNVRFLTHIARHEEPRVKRGTRTRRMRNARPGACCNSDMFCDPLHLHAHHPSVHPIPRDFSTVFSFVSHLLPGHASTVRHLVIHLHDVYTARKRRESDCGPYLGISIT